MGYGWSEEELLIVLWGSMPLEPNARPGCISSVRVFFNGNLIEQLRECEPVFKHGSAWIELFKVQY